FLVAVNSVQQRIIIIRFAARFGRNIKPCMEQLDLRVLLSGLYIWSGWHLNGLRRIRLFFTKRSQCALQSSEALMFGMQPAQIFGGRTRHRNGLEHGLWLEDMWASVKHWAQRWRIKTATPREARIFQNSQA